MNSMHDKQRTAIISMRKALQSGLVLGTATYLGLQAQSPLRPWWLAHTHGVRRMPASDDALSGNDGNDLLQRIHTPGCAITGTAGAETIIFGGTACDTAFGLSGDDILYSYTGTTPDTLLADGGAGSDYLYTVGKGVAIMYGGTEDDEMEINALRDIFLFAGDDNDIARAYSYNEDIEIEGGLGDDVLIGYAYRGFVHITGDGDNDNIRAITFEDDCLIEGGTGNDFIWAGSAEQSCHLQGGDGNDSIQSATLTGPQNWVEGGIGDDVIVVGLNHPYAADAAYLYGGANLQGGDGNDVLLAHTGNDTLNAGSGADHLRAYVGDDLLVASDALLAEADGGPGTDLLRTDFSFSLDDAGRTLRALERLDISGTAGRTLTAPNGATVHAATSGVNALTGTSATLVVDGGGDDQVVLGTSWTFMGSGTLGILDYNIYSSSDSATLWISKDISVSVGVIDNQVPSLGMSVGPNPTQGKLVVCFANPIAGPYTLSLRDAVGREVHVQQGWSNFGEVRLDLDLPQVSNGFYLLKMKTLAGSACQKVWLD
jgi:Ca2+-binding RTX toxin-like protein